MHFGFILDSSNTGLWNTRFVRYTFRFVRYKWLQKTFCLSPRRFADIFKTCLQDRSSRRLQDMSSRRLQYVFSVTIFRLPRCLQDVFKTSCEMSSRRLQDVLEDEKLLRWRRIEDVFKICLEDQQMFAGLVSKVIHTKTNLQPIVASLKLQVSLCMFELFVNTKRWRVKKHSS